jgi:hypothetical protein
MIHMKLKITFAIAFEHEAERRECGGFYGLASVTDQATMRTDTVYLHPTNGASKTLECRLLFNQIITAEMKIDCPVYYWTEKGMSTTGGLGEFIGKRCVERLLSEADLKSQKIIDALRSQLSDEGYDSVA